MKIFLSFALRKASTTLKTSCESSLVACEMKKPKVRSLARSTGADAELSVEQPRNLSSSGGCDGSPAVMASRR